MKILHVVTETIDNRVNGYTIRTDRLVRAQRELGIQADVIRSKDDAWPAGYHDLIHAHTPWSNAVRAALLQDLSHSRRWIYEIRGLQHESAVLEGTMERDSDRFRSWEQAEDWARIAADRCFAICPTLANEVRMKAGRTDTVITPNAVDTDEFQPLKPNEIDAVRKCYNIPIDRPVIGYIGSLRYLEGVENLIRWFSDVLRQVPGALCLVCGDGPNLQELIALAEGLGLQRQMLWRGPLPPEEIPTLLASIDCVAITRPATGVTSLVTPIKPLEALACGVPVVSRDLPALRYVGEHGTLFYSRNRSHDFADRVAEAIENRQTLGGEGRAWVEKERTWKHVAQIQIDAYRDILAV